MFNSFTPLMYYGDAALLLARLIAGVVMIYFGLPKIKNLRSNSEDFVKMGFRPGIFWGTIVAFVEFFGGIAILIGIYAWIVAIFFGFEMILGTIWKIAKTDKPFSDYSYDLLLLALMLVFLAFGSGAYALDALFF